jgi:phage shock protein C
MSRVCNFRMPSHVRVMDNKRSTVMNTTYKQLRRTSGNRMIAGVCGGLGEYANIDPTLIRLVAVLLLILSGPGIVLAYLIMALIIPEAPATQPKTTE